MKQNLKTKVRKYYYETPGDLIKYTMVIDHPLTGWTYHHSIWKMHKDQNGIYLYRKAYYRDITVRVVEL